MRAYVSVMFSALLILIAVINFGLFVAFQAMGRVVGQHIRRRREELPSTSVAVEGSLFGLLALLLAFTFAGGQDRLDARRNLIVQEAAAMGTAYSRVDMLPPATQPELRELFKEYADARIAYYKTVVSDRRIAKVQHARAGELQESLWHEVTTALGMPGSHPETAIVVLPAFNEMFDVTIARDVALRTHLPLPVMLLLELLSLACAFFAGMDMGRNGHRGWMHVLVFAGTMAVTTYVIVDLEFPRIGLSQVVQADEELVKVRAAM